MPTVVVCDDDERLRELMKVTLGRSYTCLEAADARTAIELCRSARPDVLLLDVMLPGDSGLEVLRTVRGDDELRETPVVVISAWRSEQDREEAAAAGADAFLGKPFELEDLIETVTALLEGGR